MSSAPCKAEARWHLELCAVESPLGQHLRYCPTQTLSTSPLFVQCFSIVMGIASNINNSLSKSQHVGCSWLKTQNHLNKFSSYTLVETHQSTWITMLTLQSGFATLSRGLRNGLYSVRKSCSTHSSHVDARLLATLYYNLVSQHYQAEPVQHTSAQIDR